MKVGELIQLLQQHDQELQVMVRVPDHDIDVVIGADTTLVVQIPHPHHMCGHFRELYVNELPECTPAIPVVLLEAWPA